MEAASGVGEDGGVVGDEAGVALREVDDVDVDELVGPAGSELPLLATAATVTATIPTAMTSDAARFRRDLVRAGPRPAGFRLFRGALAVSCPSGPASRGRGKPNPNEESSGFDGGTGLAITIFHDVPKITDGRTIRGRRRDSVVPQRSESRRSVTSTPVELVHERRELIGRAIDGHAWGDIPDGQRRYR